jgi:hypothetical protein
MTSTCCALPFLAVTCPYLPCLMEYYLIEKEKKFKSVNLSKLRQSCRLVVIFLREQATVVLLST